MERKIKAYEFKSVISARKQAERELEFFNKMAKQRNNLNTTHNHAGIEDCKFKSLIKDRIIAEGNLNFSKETESKEDSFNVNSTRIKACQFESVIEAKKQAAKKLEFFNKMMDRKNNPNANHDARI